MWPLSLRFPHQTPLQAATLHHTRYMPRPSQTATREVSSRPGERGYITYSAFKKATWPGKIGISFPGYRLHSWDNRLTVHRTMNRCPAGYRISPAHWLTLWLTNAFDAMVANPVTNQFCVPLRSCRLIGWPCFSDITQPPNYRYPSLNDGNTFWEMRP
jgi:hypothetical protein